VCACYVCNTIKGHKTHMKPIKKPIKPDYYQLIDNARKIPIKIPSETWIKYIGWDPSLITLISPNHN